MQFVIEHRITAEDSTNKIYSGKHWSFRKKKADYWKWLVHQSLKEQCPKYTAKNPVIISISYDSNLDIDNHSYIAKMIIDGMKGYLITDDTRRYVVGLIQKFHKKGKEKIFVDVDEIF